MTVLLIFQIIAVLSVVFIEHKKPGEAVLWASVITLLPFFGLLLYLCFGSTISIKLTYWLFSRHMAKPYLELLKKQIGDFEQAELHETQHRELVLSTIRFHMQYCDALLTRHNRVEILTNGKDKYARLFADLEAATESIHIAYYAIHNDEVGQALSDVLTYKAKQGVRVRVLYDRVGSLLTPKALFAPLEAAGGMVHRIKPVLTHFRNHRKIVVIDGRIGYTGGMNIGIKYLGRFRHKSPWRDTHMRIMGESVRALQYYFLYDWLYTDRRQRHALTEQEIRALFPPCAVSEELFCQVITGGADTFSPHTKLSVLKVLSAARERIVIQSPYFIPSDSILEILKVALASGVQVTLMLPAQKSSFFLKPVTDYYISQLLPLGVKVLLYEGYIHAKTITVDDAITCIGSVNIDIRSLEIDDEVQVIFYGEAMAARHQEILCEDARRCHALDVAAFENRGIVARIKERFFRLFAPLM